MKDRHAQSHPLVARLLEIYRTAGARSLVTRITLAAIVAAEAACAFIYWATDLQFRTVTGEFIGYALPLLLALGIAGVMAAVLVSALEVVVDSERELADLARTDELTGLSNRHALGETALREVARARRFGSPLSVLVLDVDRFKSINDRLGHLAGDALLRHLATLCRRRMRRHDVAVRLGGDEFSLVLSGTETLGAATLGLRLIEDVRASSVSWRGRRIQYAISVGVAGFDAGDDDLDGVLARADACLYEVKRTGGGGLAVWDDGPSLL